MKLETYSDFHKIVIEKKTMIDVRAPIEYSKGSFINAINLPLMNNDERHRVGICYKEKGNEEAMSLGHQLVCGEVKQARVNAWSNYLHENPNSLIYCFRGGSRSKISQQWIYESTGLLIPRLEGGYKAFRNYLIKALDPVKQNSTPIILGGYTGSGKTVLIKKLDNAIDLEALANHRGSSFGQQVTPQTSQINFENNLAYAMILHKHQGFSTMILEDEGRNVGRCFLPKPLVEHFNGGSVVILEVPLEERVEITRKEYVEQSQINYIKIYGKEIGIKNWYDNIKGSIDRVKKRLGLERYKQVNVAFSQAFKVQIEKGIYSSHNIWVRMLLQEYYDPMYQYQIQNKIEKIVFRGNAVEVLDYLKYVSSYNI
ncbi:MAG: tRNA 2-selenouridine(34) synthase MnmH [Eubacteriaceae bacterium]